MERKRLVLDANILIRGCFGRRVRGLLADYADKADFYMAQAALTEARHYVVDLARRRGLEDDLLEPGREEAQARIRDPEDWPTLDLRHCGAFSGPIKAGGFAAAAHRAPCRSALLLRRSLTATAPISR
jgi:hypothetical protein